MGFGGLSSRDPFVPEPDQILPGPIFPRCQAGFERILLRRGERARVSEMVVEGQSFFGCPRMTGGHLEGPHIGILGRRLRDDDRCWFCGCVCDQCAVGAGFGTGCCVGSRRCRRTRLSRGDTRRLGGRRRIRHARRRLVQNGRFRRLRRPLFSLARGALERRRSGFEARFGIECRMLIACGGGDARIARGERRLVSLGGGTRLRGRCRRRFCERGLCRIQFVVGQCRACRGLDCTRRHGIRARLHLICASYRSVRTGRGLILVCGGDSRGRLPSAQLERSPQHADEHHDTGGGGWRERQTRRLFE